jgi:hypothetical protein
MLLMTVPTRVFFLRALLLQEVLGADGHGMVAVHHLALVIHQNNPVAVPVQGDAQIGVMAADHGLQDGGVGGTALPVDVAAVGPDAEGDDLGPQLRQHRGSDPVGGAMGAVQSDLEAVQASGLWGRCSSDR